MEYFMAKNTLRHISLDRLKIDYLLAKYGLAKEDVAREMELEYYAFSRRLSNNTDMTAKEIIILHKILKAHGYTGDIASLFVSNNKGGVNCG